MTLTTHALVGASLAALVPEHPVAGFAVGFLSHFVLDAIPHWDYHLRSRLDNNERPLDGDIRINGDFARDLIHVAFDGLLGVLVALLIFRPDTDRALATIVLGGLGGELPDALQLAYFKIRREPLTALMRFHMWVHADGKIGRWPLGILAQISIVAAVAYVAALI